MPKRIREILDEKFAPPPIDIYHLIETYPGRKYTELAHLSGYHRNAIVTALVKMEGEGLLVSEDDAGRLYPFAIAEIGCPIRNGRR